METRCLGIETGLSNHKAEYFKEAGIQILIYASRLAHANYYLYKDRPFGKIRFFYLLVRPNQILSAQSLCRSITQQELACINLQASQIFHE